MEVFCPRLMTCTSYVCILADIFSPVRKVDGCNRAFYSNFSRFVFPLIIQLFLAYAFLEYYHLLFLIQGQCVSISTFCFEFRAWNFLLMQKYHDNLTKNILSVLSPFQFPLSSLCPHPHIKKILKILNGLLPCINRRKIIDRWNILQNYLSININGIRFGKFGIPLYGYASSCYKAN